MKNKIKPMRKVLYKKWIPAEFPPQSNAFTGQSRTLPLKGTNCFEEEFTGAGTFLAWGIDYQLVDGGVGNYTTALVELPNGEVIEMLPSNIKFVES